MRIHVHLPSRQQLRAYAKIPDMRTRCTVNVLKALKDAAVPIGV